MSTPAENFDIAIDESSENEAREKAINELPSTVVEENAEELGMVKRDGKLQILDLVWAFVFGFRRSYNSTADETLFPAASLAPVRLTLWKPSYQMHFLASTIPAGAALYHCFEETGSSFR